LIEKEKAAGRAAMRTTTTTLRLGWKDTQIPMIARRGSVEKEKAAMRATTMSLRLGKKGTQIPRLGLQDTRTLRGGVIVLEDARDTEFHIQCDSPSRPYVTTDRVAHHYFADDTIIFQVLKLTHVLFSMSDQLTN
jgi:hypothetical protein